MLLPSFDVSSQINSRSSHALCSAVPPGRLLSSLSPLQLLKAVKNETEAKGMKEAHVRREREGGREGVREGGG